MQTATHQAAQSAAEGTQAGELPPTGLSAAEREPAFDTLLLAFSADPVERWLWPSADDYLAHFPRFVDAYGGAAFDQHTAWQADDHRAVALWIPPGGETDDDATLAALLETTDPALHAEILSVLEQLDEAHPREPHWYLPWFGVDPAVQSRGVGSALMRAGLAHADADHLPTYLETPNPRNITFYERHGFAVVDVTESSACPPVTSMLRQAR